MSDLAFFSPTAHGHVNPMLPIARELARRGERVHFTCHEAFRPAIERTGAAFHPYPAPGPAPEMIAAQIGDGNLARVSALLLEETERLLPFTLTALERAAPDLVVFDGMALWARMAATLQGRPAVATIPTFIFEGTPEGRLKPRELVRLLRWLPAGVLALFRTRRRLIRRYGAAAFPPLGPLFPARGELNLSFTARALHPDSPVIDDTFRFVGPSIDPQTRRDDTRRDDTRRDDTPGDSWPGDRPLVYISLGTVNSGRVDFYRHCFAAFGDHPAGFILAAGRGTDLAALGPIPANFSVHATVPQLELLPRVDAFITHAGMNSVHEALYDGVPLVMVPQQFEQLLVARTMAARGVGPIIETGVAGGAVRPADLRRALVAVMKNPAYRTAARRVQADLRATGGYHQAADEIQTFLARR